MSERREKWECYETLHGGEGHRGQRVVVNPCWPRGGYPIDQAAEAAAAHFHELDDRKNGPFAFEEGETLDYYVEVVESPEKSQFFRVRLEVQFKFTANPSDVTANT